MKEQTKPPRDVREGGRERVLAAARTMLRSKVRHEVSRKEIARHAGVAPGLLTYYFATNPDLVLAITRPVMTEAIAKLLAAIDGPGSAQERLKQSVSLFIAFARENGPLLDLFVEAILEGGDESGQTLIGSCLQRLGLFFSEAVEVGLIADTTDPRRLLLAMWGMCRLVGETPPLPLHPFGPEQRPISDETDVEFITKLMLQGAGPTR